MQHLCLHSLLSPLVIKCLFLIFNNAFGSGGTFVQKGLRTAVTAQGDFSP